MNKGKKNIIVFTVAVLLLGGLVGVYLWQGNRQREAEAAATPTPAPAVTSLTLIERDENELKNVVFKTEERTLTLEARYGADGAGTLESWFIADEPEIEIDQTVAKDMVRGFSTLSVVEKLFDTAENPADFGFSPDMATATATYTDGTQATLHIGKMTPAKDRYYVMLEGDPAIYLMYTYYGERYFNKVGALIDRSLPTVAADTMEYLLIAQRGKEPIEFGFYGTSEEMQEMYEQYGMIYVTMLQPYPGRELYYSNFEERILVDFMNFQFNDMVELRPDDLSAYGLDDPSLHVILRDAENEINLLIGDKFGEDQVYCKYMDKPYVFLADYNYVKLLYDINVFSFIERFMALVNIEECKAIDIVGTDGTNYHMELNHDILPPEEDEEEGEKIVKPDINGQTVQDKAFRTFYQRLIGLSYEVEVEEYVPTDEPAVTITYTMIDKPEAVLRLYTYDNNFYAAKRDDNPIQFVTSRQSVEIMLQTMTDLLAGKLDR